MSLGIEEWLSRPRELLSNEVFRSSVVSPNIHLLNPGDLSEIQTCLAILNDPSTVEKLAGSMQSKESLIERASTSGVHVFVARNLEGEIVGTATSIDPEPLSLTTTHITAVAVRKDVQGKGVGKQLMTYVIDRLFNTDYEGEKGGMRHSLHRMNLYAGVIKAGSDTKLEPMERLLLQLGFHKSGFSKDHIRIVKALEQEGEERFLDAVSYNLHRDDWSDERAESIIRSVLGSKHNITFSS